MGLRGLDPPLELSGSQTQKEEDYKHAYFSSILTNTPTVKPQ